VNKTFDSKILLDSPLEICQKKKDQEDLLDLGFSETSVSTKVLKENTLVSAQSSHIFIENAEGNNRLGVFETDDEFSYTTYLIEKLQGMIIKDVNNSI
jgi:hypothetical protein